MLFLPYELVLFFAAAPSDLIIFPSSSFELSYLGSLFGYVFSFSSYPSTFSSYLIKFLFELAKYSSSISNDNSESCFSVSLIICG